MIIVKIMKEAQIMRFIEHSSNPKEMKNEKKKTNSIQIETPMCLNPFIE